MGSRNTHCVIASMLRKGDKEATVIGLRAVIVFLGFLQLLNEASRIWDHSVFQYLLLWGPPTAEHHQSGLDYISQTVLPLSELGIDVSAIVIFNERAG